jgi:hypothetical protein
MPTPRRCRGKHAAARRRALPRPRRGASRRFVRVATWALVVPVSVAAAVPQSLTTSPVGSTGHVDRVGEVVGTAVVTQAASVTLLSEDVAAIPAAVRDAADGVVPEPALRAYRLAESALRIVDPGCRLSWDVLAGIGGLESDHGRLDSGRLGPMRIVPSVWRMVGVDGDADGERNPRDLDDAALAAATYLCSGPEDLGTELGQEAALLRYNHSAEYATVAMRVATEYERSVDRLPPLAALALGPDGPGVEVGVGTPAAGVLIGGSDDVSGGDASSAAGRQGHRPGREDRTGRPKGPGGHSPHENSSSGTGGGGRGLRPDHNPGGSHGDGKDHGHGRGEPRPGSGPGPAQPKPAPAPKPDGNGSPDRPRPPRPAPSKPPRPGSGGQDRPGPSKPPATLPYAGLLDACGGDYCLTLESGTRYRLVGTQPFPDYLGQQVVVTGSVQSRGTLAVDDLVPAGS